MAARWRADSGREEVRLCWTRGLGRASGGIKTRRTLMECSIRRWRLADRPDTRTTAVPAQSLTIADNVMCGLRIADRTSVGLPSDRHPLFCPFLLAASAWSYGPSFLPSASLYPTPLLNPKLSPCRSSSSWALERISQLRPTSPHVRAPHLAIANRALRYPARSPRWTSYPPLWREPFRT